MALVFGMMVVGCDNDPDNGGGDGGQSLSAANGVNAVSGKTYYEGYGKITFFVTANGDVKGTYVIGFPNCGTYGSGVKIMYQDMETGTYTWSERAKTVTLKPEKVFSGGYGIGGDIESGFTVYENNGSLFDKTGYRSYGQAMINEAIKEMGQAAFNQQLSEMGFSSVSAYLDYMVNKTFGNRTNTYSFSADGTALFLETALPANKGTNELSGQTYNDDWYIGIKYIFTSSGYNIFTNSGNGTPITTGSYAYDSIQKLVWLSPSTIYGGDRTAYYAGQTAYSGHPLIDDNAYRAAQTNDAFKIKGCDYNSTNKTIYGGGYISIRLSFR